MRDALAPKCDLTQDRVTFYDGVLWLEDGDATLSVHRLAALEGLATLCVGGELTIDEDVPPAALAEKLAKVHNHGTILCNAAQSRALHLRLGANKGELRVTDEESEQPPRRKAWRGIGNTGYLAL